jgi:hypothetical protein
MATDSDLRLPPSKARDNDIARGPDLAARRTLGGAPMLPSVTISGYVGGGSGVEPCSMRTRHVEQRARPPQTDACGTLAARLISSSVGPSGTLMVGPPV